MTRLGCQTVTGRESDQIGVSDGDRQRECDQVGVTDGDGQRE